MPCCPVCAEVVDCDEAAFEHHVNACLEGGSSSTQPSSHSEQCPICSKTWKSLALSTSAQSDHVEACLSQGRDLGRLEEGASDLECPLCAKSFSHFEQLESHAAICASAGEAFSIENFDELRQGHASTSRLDDFPQNDKENGNRKTQPPKSHSELFPIIAALLERAHDVGYSTNSILCASTIAHICCEWGVDWGWGCGYRCMQMLYSAIPYSTSESAMPSLHRFQQILEDAWSQGYDPAGSKHFGGRVVGRRKWIGTTEVYAAFTFLGIPAQIIDFPDVKGGDGVHTKLIDWVRGYFRDGAIRSQGSDAHAILMQTKGAACTQTDKQPLFLQHQGHSRVIIGIEESKKDACLLVFDPNIKDKAAVLKGAEQFKQESESASSSASPSSSISEDDKHSNKKRKLDKVVLPVKAASNWLHAVTKSNSKLDLSDHATLLGVYRLSLRSLSKNDQYQILYVLTNRQPLSPSERLQKRIPSSIRK